MDLHEFPDDAVAVVGLSCRFPGAASYGQFWDNLCRGVVSVSFFSDEELLREGVDSALLHDHSYVKAGYVLNDTDKFDASFFGYAGSEAQTIDPQHRIFLESVWEALEDAGVRPMGGNDREETIGIFAGTRMSSYFSHIYKGAGSGSSAEAFQALIGNDKDYLCSRVSYKLDLRGPSMGIQSACSSSLVAVHQACENLRSGTCDIAVAGGVAVNVPQNIGYLYQPGMIMSPDGYCRPFDSAAGGTVFSSGVGVVVLKRLSDALENHDHIYAAVLASAVDNDGAARVGFTAPGAEGQQAVLQEAFSLAEVSPEDINYIETHGTGTAIGDSIELSSLSKVFGKSSPQHCALGALKANIGHADAASGIAGFIKAVLSVYHGKIAPHPLYQHSADPEAFAKTPFFINTEVAEWPADRARVAGVSSFGIGGTNAHVIIRDVPQDAVSLPEGRTEFFALSSRDEERLKNLAARFAEELRPDQNLADICLTVRAGRAWDQERIAFPVSSVEELRSLLKGFAEGREEVAHGRMAEDGKSGTLLTKCATGNSALRAMAERYVSGEENSLAMFQQEARKAGARMVALPTTPFKRKRYWYDEEAGGDEVKNSASTPMDHAVWDRHISLPYERDFFMGHLSELHMLELAEHQLRGRAVAPASFIFELLHRGAEELDGKSVELKSVTVSEPLALDRYDIALQMMVDSSADSRNAEIFVRDEESATWKRLARAEVAAAQESEEEKLDLDALRDSMTEQMNVSDYYASFRNFGLNYGDAFRLIKELRRNDEGQVLAHVVRQGHDNGYGWNPALLDSCLQTVMASMEKDNGEESRTFIPVGCEALRLCAQAPEEVWVRTASRHPDKPDAEQLFVDLTICDAEGRVIGVVDGLRMKALPDNFGQENVLPEPYCYRISWEQLASPKTSDTLDCNQWLVLADGLFQKAIAESLKEQGASCRVLSWDNEADLEKVLDELAATSRPFAILHAWSRESDDREGWDESYARGAYALLRISQKCMTYATQKQIRLVICTSGAFGPDMALLHPRQAMLKGLQRSIENECLFRSLILDSEAGEEGVKEVAAALRVQSSDTCLALRAGRYWAPRMLSLPRVQSSQTVRALTQTEAGLDNLFFEKREEKMPEAGEVEVELLASSLNFRDVMMAMGIYPGDTTALGSDASGRVVRVGEGVEGFHIGDAVVVSAFGCFRSRITVKAAQVRKIPAGMDMAQAAALPVVYTTAWYALRELAHISAGQTVLVHAASGGVGLAAMSLCKAAGARVFATAGSEEKREYVRQLGAEMVMDSRSTDFARQIMEATQGRGVDVVLNSLAGKPQEVSFGLVAEGGIFVEIGKSNLKKEGEKISDRENVRYRSVDLVDLGNNDPELMGRILSGVMEECASGKLDMLPVKTFSMNNFAEAFRFMVKTKHIGKVVLTWDNDGADARHADEGTELISGGLGGLGMMLAERRVRDGARHLMLVARHDPDATQTKRIEAMRAQGAEIRLVKADVADAEALTSAYKAQAEGMPPLTKIFHLAGRLEDDLLARLTPERFKAVFLPKVEGAWNLHQLSLGAPLTHFVMFSSTASVLGSHGQGNYAAANAYLDGLAAYRHAQGLPALAVSWGAWSQAGMVARLGLESSLSHMGIHSFPLQQGFTILEKLMQGDSAHVIATDIDWKRFSESLGLMTLPPMFKHVMQQKASGRSAAPALSELRKKILSMSPDARRSAVKEHVAAKVASVLKVDRAALGDDANLIHMGMDSLLALDLFQSLEKNLGVQLERSLLFENPVLGDLTDRIAALVEKGVARPDSDIPQVEPRLEQRFDPFHLVDMQQAYWVGRTGALELGNVSCHVYLELDNEGLDLDAYRYAWDKLIARHDMLRAIILPDGRQRVLESVPPLDIDVLDMSAADDAAAEEAVQERRALMSHEVLLPDEWPLFKVAVTLLPGGKSRIHLGLDLLIADLHSMNLIMNDLALFYKDRSYAPKKLDFSFRDYVLALDEFRKGDTYQRDREYWMKRIGDIPPAPDLPLALSPSEIKTPRFVRHASSLCREDWDALQQKAKKANLTVSGLLLSAYSEVLARWSTKPDFTVNVTLFNRLPVHAEVMDIVGDFTSVSLLDIHHAEANSFLKRAAALQHRLWSDMDHSSFSGVEVVREWAKQTGKNSGNIMPVVFTSTIGLGGKNDTHPALNAFGQISYNITQTPQVWIDHQVREVAGELQFNWDAVDELFPAGLVDVMFQSYCRLLRMLAHDDKIWEKDALPLLPADQVARRRQVNATFADYQPMLLTDFFVRALKEHPDQPALLGDGVSLTYRELGVKVQSLIHALKAEGCRKGDFIAVASDGGWQERVAALAVLALGAVYMPVDAQTPENRMAFILEHSRCRHLLMAEAYVAREWPSQAVIVSVDKAVAEDHGEFDLNCRNAEPDDLAYVIHTSGSTGTPKGVMIRHNGAANTIQAVNNMLHLSDQDRCIAISSFTFDLSVWDFFGLMAAGGCSVLLKPEQRLDPASWLTLMNRHGVTLWNTVPSLMQMYMDHLEYRKEGQLPPLRAALLSGDWIPLNLPDRVHAIFPELQLYSLGGATEASIWSNFYPVGRHESFKHSVPYGKPLPNQTFFILNREGHACPDWVPGELFIGGAGLATGYCNDRQKSAEHFVLHPETGEALYATGDLGCYMADGNIEFLGRLDHQVKINGYRVELGEIENALLKHPAVGQVVVMGLGEKRALRGLVAFVEARQNVEAPQSEELHAWLSSYLPSYMVPGMILVRKELPRTSSGKIDRKKLVVLSSDTGTKQPAQVPQTEMEQAISSVLQEVLKQDNLDLDSRFFEMGLSSLDLVNVQNMLQEKTQRSISVINLLEHTTIRTLAAFLTEKSAAEAAGQTAGHKAEQMVARGMSRAERRLRRRGH